MTESSRCPESSQEGARCVHEAGHDGPHFAKDGFSYYSWETRSDAPSSVESAHLSMAYSDAVTHMSAVYEGSLVGPIGQRVAIHIPEAQWERLATAVCAITGGDVV